jgi:hypothetical protein
MRWLQDVCLLAGGLCMPAVSLLPQPKAGINSAVTGVWRAQIDGGPAFVMVISDEGGSLTGAILFYMIRRQEGQPPSFTPGLPEPMFDMKFDRSELDFRVSHRRAHPPKTAGDPPVEFRLKITGLNDGLLVRGDGGGETVRVSRDQ